MAEGVALGPRDPLLGGERGDGADGAVVHRRLRRRATSERVQHAGHARRGGRERRARRAQLGHEEVARVMSVRTSTPIMNAEGASDHPAWSLFRTMNSL